MKFEGLAKKENLNKDGVHFYTLNFECHNRYNKLLLFNSENGNIG